MNKKVQLRKEIVTKFRTLSNFCEITGVPYKKVMRVLNGNKVDSESIKELRATCKETEGSITGLILDDDRPAIRICILTRFNDYTAFHKKHNEFNNLYISNLITGRLVEETTKYKSLVKLLTNKYGLDKEILKRINK